MGKYSWDLGPTDFHISYQAAVGTSQILVRWTPQSDELENSVAMRVLSLARKFTPYSGNRPEQVISTT